MTYQQEFDADKLIIMISECSLKTTAYLENAGLDENHTTEISLCKKQFDLHAHQALSAKDRGDLNALRAETKAAIFACRQACETARKVKPELPFIPHFLIVAQDELS